MFSHARQHPSPPPLPAPCAQAKDAAALMRAIQAAVVSAVTPLWRSERLASCPPAILNQVGARAGARLLPHWPGLGYLGYMWPV